MEQSQTKIHAFSLRVFKNVLVDLKLMFTKEAATENGSMFLMQSPK